MKCEEARRLLPLYVYGELPPADEERFEAHVHECDPCRKELDTQHRFGDLLTATAVSGLPEGMLTAARLQLRQSLAVEPKPGAGRSWLRDFFSFHVSAAPAWAQALGGLALIAMGFLSARVAPASWGLAPSEAGMAGTPVASEVQYVQPEQSGRVQVVVDETRQVVLRGSLDDDRIRRMLVRATREAANPGLRVQSVELLKNDCGSPEIRAALLQSLQHDPDPGVRMEALNALKGFASDPETRDVFSRVLLEDRNPGIRTEVIGVLVQHRQDDMVGIFQDLMRQEPNVYVRQKCQKALKSLNASAEAY